MSNPSLQIQPPVELRCKDELEALEIADAGNKKPIGWRLSPRSVITFITGGGNRTFRTNDGREITITPKFVGPVDIIQVAVATLASDRALLLVGEPGTAKSYLSEHLAAAISSNSQLIIQGSQGTTEEQLRYSWSPALLIAEGHSQKSIVHSPMMRAMMTGQICRIEEVTRLPSEVSDALISILSEKALAIPELDEVLMARHGFNVIATANTRDRGVNEMSVALKRRFNFVSIPSIADLETEIDLVRRRVGELMNSYRIDADVPEDLVRLVVQVFSDLRKGKTREGRTVRQPSTTLSTAEAISVVFQSAILGEHFGNGTARLADAAKAMIGAVAKENEKDLDAFHDYVTNHANQRQSSYWLDFAATVNSIMRN